MDNNSKNKFKPIYNKLLLDSIGIQIMKQTPYFENINQIDKTYNFSYGSAMKKFLSKTVELVINCIGSFFIIVFYTCIVTALNYELKVDFS